MKNLSKLSKSDLFKGLGEVKLSGDLPPPFKKPVKNQLNKLRLDLSHFD